MLYVRDPIPVSHRLTDNPSGQPKSGPSHPASLIVFFSGLVHVFGIERHRYQTEIKI
jgi:hypothetical protein